MKIFDFSVISGSSLMVAHMMALKVYKVVNFKVRGINRGVHKLIGHLY
jgi:hypothetical protein